MRLHVLIIMGRIHSHVVWKVKVCFYIAQYPVRCTAQSASLSGRPVRLHSDTNSTPFGKHSSHAAIMCEDYSLAFPPLSNSVYSQVLIHTSEWTEASWRERKCPNFETVAKGWFKLGLSIASPELLWRSTVYMWVILLRDTPHTIIFQAHEHPGT